jgi:hypothetical protein
MATPIPILTLPDIKNKNRHLLQSPHSKTSPTPSDKLKTGQKSEKASKIQLPVYYKQISSKINTGLRKKQQASTLPDVKFEPFMWSNNTTLQPGFFVINRTSDIVKQSLPVTRVHKDRSLSYNKNYIPGGCERIEEFTEFSPRVFRKFAKVDSPWKFQVSTFITPSDTS